MSISSRERMISALKCQNTDHVPFSPFIVQGAWMEKPLFWRNQFDRAEQMLDLGLDPIIDIWLPWPQIHKDVEIREWRDTSGKEPIITKEYHTPAGVLRSVVRETEDWCSAWHTPWIPTTMGGELRDDFCMHMWDDWNVSRRLEPWVKSPEDLEKLKYCMGLPTGHDLDVWKMDTERALEKAKKYDLISIARRTIVGDAFQWFCDIPQFLMWIADEPQFIRDFFQIFQDWSIEVTKLALEAGVDAVQRRGWYEVPCYWGPKHFKDMFVPMIEEETKLVHDAGKIHIYLLPEGQGIYADILKDMSLDCHMGIDPRMLHGGDMWSLYEKLGEKQSFWGGVNAEVTIESHNPDRIAGEVRDSIEALNQNGGFILGAFLFQQIHTQDVMHMIDAWKKYR